MVFPSQRRTCGRPHAGPCMISEGLRGFENISGQSRGRDKEARKTLQRPGGMLAFPCTEPQAKYW